jgi:hypothetical protein
MRVHDLRHSCATNLFAQGGGPEMVQERLGHSSLMTTISIYKAYIQPLHRRMAQLQEPWGGELSLGPQAKMLQSSTTEALVIANGDI